MIIGIRKISQECSGLNNTSICNCIMTFSVKSVTGHDWQLVVADIMGDMILLLASRGGRRWDMLLNRNEAIRTKGAVIE